MPFVRVPKSYYTIIHAEVQEVPVIACNMDKISSLDILVDTHTGTWQKQDTERPFLLQTFTLPLHDRATMFVEIIQRVGGADGFGRGNMQALFQAVEQAQEN